MTARLVPALTLLLAAACREIPAPYQLPDLPSEVPTVDRGLSRVNPTELAIAPLEFATQASQRAPQTHLRMAAAEWLTYHRYSPLSLEFVDGTVPGGATSRVIDASYRPGSVGEDAVVRIVVHGWDEGSWISSQKLEVDVEVLIESPVAAEGTLWTARLERSFDFADEVRLEANHVARMRKACSLIMEEALSNLPDRVVEPGIGD